MSVITIAEKETAEIVESTGNGKGESVFAQKMREAQEQKKKSVTIKKKNPTVASKPSIKKDVGEEKGKSSKAKEVETPNVAVTEVEKVSLGSVAKDILYAMRYDVKSERGTGRNIVSVNPSDALKLAEKITSGEIAQEVYNEVANELRQYIYGKNVVLQRYYRLIVDRKLLAVGKRVKMLSNGKLYLRTIIKKQKS